MFIDTSAIIAILTEEVLADQLLSRIADTQLAVSSPLVILEASMVLSSKLSIDPIVAEARVRTLLDHAKVAIMAIDDRTATLAIAAFSKYGKGRGNSAKLNMSDCLSYACAKQHRMPLLYIGDDFSATDLA